MSILEIIETNKLLISILVGFAGIIFKVSKWNNDMNNRYDKQENRFQEIETKVDQISQGLQENKTTESKDIRELRDMQEESTYKLVKHINRQLDRSYREIQKEIDTNLNNKLKSYSDNLNILEGKIDEINNNKQDYAERTRIIMNGTEATLKSLMEYGHNGPVTESLKEIEEYKSRKASEW